MNISVSIVEGDQEVRSSLAKLINGSSGYRCISQHGSAESAMLEIPKINPNVILMDVMLPGLDGIECVRRLRPKLPTTQIVMLTLYQNIEHIINALMAGAAGYLLKQAPYAELLDAIRVVYNGGSPMSSQVARRVVQFFQRASLPAHNPEALSPRQIQVLDLLTNGHSYKEIAEMMQISYATVHTHIRHIYKKLQVHSRTQAVAKNLRQSQWEIEALDGLYVSNAVWPSVTTQKQRAARRRCLLN